MNKFCYVRYEKSDTNDVNVTDFPDFRVVDCSFKKRLGFFGKRRVRKFTDGFCTLDENKISEEDTRQLYFRFCYPEKFWKIVNYYYNSRKAFIPEKNREKLELVLSQENKKKEFIEKVM